MGKDTTVRNACIPLVIGVTGHRDICEEDLRYAKEAVRGEVRRLAALCPNTPVVMLSSLAKGADQICAQVALEEKIGLITVLPMPLGEYKKDFEGPDLEKLERLVARSDSVFVSPFEEEEREGRDFLYRQAGIYITRRSHVLIALWDGTEPTRGGCGTDEMVDIMLHGNTFLKQEGGFTADKGTVIHVPVKRGVLSDTSVNASNTVESGREVRILGDEVNFHEILKRTEEFNKHAIRLIESKEKKEGKARRKKSGKAGAKSNTAETIKRRLENLYNISDELSIRGSKAYRISIAMIAVMATLLTMSFLLYDEANMHYLIIMCGVMIFGVYAVNAADGRYGFHRKYLQYRLLAEGLRVQIGLSKAGIDARAFEMMPWSIQTDIPWIVRALAAVSIGEIPAGTCDKALLTGKAAASERSTSSILGWISGQKAYHEAVVRSASRKAIRNDRIVKVAIGISIFVYAAALGFEIFVAGLFTGNSLLNPDDAEFVRTVVKIATGSLSALSLFAGSYYGKLSLEERSNDSRRMAALYAEALESEAAGMDAGRLCRTLAREELGENGRWLAYKSINGTDTPIS